MSESTRVHHHTNNLCHASLENLWNPRHLSHGIVRNSLKISAAPFRWLWDRPQLAQYSFACIWHKPVADPYLRSARIDHALLEYCIPRYLDRRPNRDKEPDK